MDSTWQTSRVPQQPCGTSNSKGPNYPPRVTPLSFSLCDAAEASQIHFCLNDVGHHGGVVGMSVCFAYTVCVGFLCAKEHPLLYQNPGFGFFFCLPIHNTVAAICVIRFNHVCSFLCCDRSAFQDNLSCMLLRLPTKEGRAATVERRPSPRASWKKMTLKMWDFLKPTEHFNVSFALWAQRPDSGGNNFVSRRRCNVGTAEHKLSSGR